VSTLLTDKGILVGPTWNAQQTTGTPPREFDFAGNIIWECKHAACLPGKNVTHETQKLSNGHYVILEYVGSGTQNPVFREVDADSKEVWSLDWNALSPNTGGTGDWCHANAININIEKNEVYANCRWIGLMSLYETCATCSPVVRRSSSVWRSWITNSRNRLTTAFAFWAHVKNLKR